MLLDIAVYNGVILKTAVKLDQFRDRIVQHREVFASDFHTCVRYTLLATIVSRLSQNTHSSGRQREAPVPFDIFLIHLSLHTRHIDNAENVYPDRYSLYFFISLRVL